MSTVTATYTDTQGNPMVGTVYISPAARAGNGEPPAIVVEKRVWADLDVSGSISIDVIPSDDPGWLIDGEMPYLVEERLSGLPFRAYWIGVPETGVDLADVQQVDPEVAYVPVPGADGPPGPQGEPGGGFNVRGTVATWGDLPATGDEVGDGWFVADQPGILAVWTAAGTWDPLETVVGPEGPQGPQGDPGPAGPTAVSTDPGNLATLGGDSLIFVPDQTWDGTQAQYNALGVYDPAVTYYIVG